MRWYKATLYGPRETGEVDETRKPVTEEVPIGTAFFRVAPLKVERDSTAGNPHGCVRRTFLTRRSPFAFVGVTAFEVMGCRYVLEGQPSEAGAEIMVTGRASKWPTLG